VTNVAEYLDEAAIRRMVLTKTRTVYEKNTGDLKIVLNVLACVEKTLDRLDKGQIIDEVLPLLWDVRLQDPEVTLRVVSKCSRRVAPHCMCLGSRARSLVERHIA
jgi:SCY1-like protein 2